MKICLTLNDNKPIFLGTVSPEGNFPKVIYIIILEYTFVVELNVSELFLVIVK